MILCPHCQTPKPRLGYHNHVTACAKYPGDKEMRELWKKLGYLSYVGRALKVNKNVVAGFLKRAGIKYNGKRKKEKIKIYPQFIRFKSATTCGANYRHRCHFWRTCLELTARGRILKCEAPDQRDLELWYA